MKPILFLDVDDTLLRWPSGLGGLGVETFIPWAKSHFEVRWLTMWCPSGTLTENAAVDLALRLRVSLTDVAEIVNPHAFPVKYGRMAPGEDWRDKSVSIKAMLAETPDREWAWVEDVHLEAGERAFAMWSGRYFPTTVNFSRLAIFETAVLLAERFTLPPMPVELAQAA